MAKYILDTDTCIYLLNGERRIEEKILDISIENVSTTVITECELYYGAYKSTRVEKNLEGLKKLRERIKIIHTNADIAPVYGKIKADLERKGQRLDDADLLIAAIVIASDQILLTNNTAHFKRIPGLQIENWR